MRVKAELIDTIDMIDVANTLGEGALWRCSDQSVWWTDIQKCRSYRLSWAGVSLRRFELPERLASLGFVAGDDSRFVCAFESGFIGSIKRPGRADDLKASYLERLGLVPG